MFLEFTKDLEVKVNCGVVGDWLAKASQGQIDDAKGFSNVEWFSHSYFHFYHPQTRIREYFLMSEEYQLFSLKMATKIIEEKLGRCTTIGFPANACDQTTIKLLGKMPEIERVFYLDSCYNYKELKAVKPVININGYGVLETKDFISYDGFVERFEKRNGEDLVFQLHPNMWSQEHFHEFIKCLEYLKKLNVEFIYASEF